MNGKIKRRVQKKHEHMKTKWRRANEVFVYMKTKWRRANKVFAYMEVPCVGVVITIYTAKPRTREAWGVHYRHAPRVTGYNYWDF